jgi:hypothetical protein
MVQASQFCGKAHEDASAHLQHFLEICSTFTIKGTNDAILLHLFAFSLLGKAKQWFYANKIQEHYMGYLLHCLSSKVLPHGQNKCFTWENLKFSIET